MADPLWEDPGMKLGIWGPLAPLGLALTLLVFAVDQAHKWWMLNIYDIGTRQPVSFTPFLAGAIFVQGADGVKTRLSAARVLNLRRDAAS